MTDNKHPHHDLIVEWAKDTSKRYQFLDYDDTWEDCNDEGPIWDVNTKYRLKPREFIKGHWYPCLRDDGAVLVRMFDGLGMRLGVDLGLSVNPLQFKDIGESLGEIKFGREL